MRSKAVAGDRTREGGHGAATRADADADVETTALTTLQTEMHVAACGVAFRLEGCHLARMALSSL